MRVRRECDYSMMDMQACKHSSISRVSMAMSMAVAAWGREPQPPTRSLGSGPARGVARPSFEWPCSLSEAELCVQCPVSERPVSEPPDVVRPGANGALTMASKASMDVSSAHEIGPLIVVRAGLVNSTRQ